MSNKVLNMQPVKVLAFAIMSSLMVLGLPACGEGGTTDNAQTEAGVQAGDSEIARINALIKDEPKNAEAMAARARYHFERNNLIDATYDMASAMKLDSINESYHHLLADIYLESYKSQLALRTLERALRLFPQSVETNLKIAELRIILRKYPEAASALRTVLEVSPQNIEALQLLGVMFKEQGDLDKAQNSFQRVVDLDGDNYEAWTMLGNLMDIQGDPMALQCFENAIDIDSTYAQGWHSKAYYLQNHGDVDQAIDIYHRIQRMDSTYIDAYLNAGILYLEKGEYDSADEEFTFLSVKAPSNPLGPYYLGISFERREDYQTALGHFNQAAAISPRSAQFAEAVLRMEAELNK